ncbi:NHLP bacteriocin system secretion protein [Halorhodospira abdelmalekii]|uniref:NHLP bacteriocin system secretion protein n=1 Tax=Halorhodospira abdelmalekii TaxID=421629 RepID=UPI0019040641|nr:NHLP bacteriocin system secretion protein [Halorhodospira abdelmalekii]MBK1735239.1 NHLP bacteriocin system secretion protein [Halorhodospira abdelmalekii]
MSKKKLFRQKAIDRLASPDRLDAMIQVTTPKSWLLLSTLLALITVLVIWGILGSIPTKVQGSAVFMRTGGLYEITAGSSGRLSDMSIRVGDRVTQGQNVARLTHPELDSDLEQAMFELEELQVWQSWLEEISDLRGSAQRRYIERQRETLMSRIEALQDRLDAREQLLERGLITRQELLETRDELGDLRAQLRQIELSELESERDIKEELDDTQRRIERKRLRRDHLLTLRDDRVRVLSPYAGRVVETRVARGQLVDAGTPIAALEPDGPEIKQLEAVIFLPAYEGRRVEPGMEALLSPAGIRQEEHGLMKGRVTSVSEYPVTSESMYRLLRNESLVNDLLIQGAAYQVNVALVPEPDNYSGFRWTSAGGPQERITGGVIGDGDITIRSQRPISLLIPTVRSALGL